MRALAVITLVACSSSSSAPGAGPASDAGPGDSAAPLDDSGTDLLAGCVNDTGPTAPQFDPNAASDPMGSADKFTLAMALGGFPDGAGALTALISTEKSAIRCTLDEKAAPISVANFIGLARGTRPYRSGTTWKVGRFYDGLTWHRVIPGFVIQGGDPEGTGSGGPGYALVTENQVAEPLGTLAMAASSVPSGSQFYIVVGTGPAPSYDVFGTCTTEAAIAISKVARDANDRPTTPVHMQRIDIARCP